MSSRRPKMIGAMKPKPITPRNPRRDSLFVSAEAVRRAYAERESRRYVAAVASGRKL